MSHNNEQFIDQPQQNDFTPTRAAIFVDLTNMFNSVSRAELFDIIATDFPNSLRYSTNNTGQYITNGIKQIGDTYT